MLTRRQNLLETIRGGSPDRYVNQFEPFVFQFTPQDLRFPEPAYPGAEPTVSCWGVTNVFPENTPGPFPLAGEHRVIKDIVRWREYVTMPETVFSEEEWKPLVDEIRDVDREEYFVSAYLWPGLFENTHHLMGMEECMIALYEEPEAMHELIAYMAEYELKMAEQICKYLKPDAVYRHDDWGSQRGLFLSREMFREFYLEPTKSIYQYYKAHGVEIIVHHSDSYCEPLVPEMIEMGIDIWQGALSTNNIPKILEEYGGKITIMGGLDNGKLDRHDWTREQVAQEVERICRWAGNKYFIPNTTLGGDGSIYEGMYEAVSQEIDAMSKIMFGKEA